MKLHYGISIDSPEQLGELPELKTVDFLELPSAVCETESVAVPSAWKKRVLRFCGRRDSASLNFLLDAGQGVMLDFYREFSRQCAAFAALGAREITMGIDWENALDVNYDIEKFRKILRCCFGITSKYHLQMIFELRIPGMAAADPEGFLRFRNSLMFPSRTLIDLHPHEPGALDILSQFRVKLPFECSKFRISFDAAGGNYLSHKLLDMIRQNIRPAGAENPEICFYPGKYADKNIFESLNDYIEK